jgi:hypothetical protein
MKDATLKRASSGSRPPGVLVDSPGGAGSSGHSDTFWCGSRGRPQRRYIFGRGHYGRYIFGRVPCGFHGCVPLASFVRFLRRFTAFLSSSVGLPCGSSFHRRFNAFLGSGVGLPCRSRLICSGSSFPFSSRFLCGGTAISSALHDPEYNRTPRRTHARRKARVDATRRPLPQTTFDATRL